MKLNAGPKIQFGGFHWGLFNCSYQVWTDLLKIEPIAAAAKHTSANGNKDSHESRLNILKEVLSEAVRTIAPTCQRRLYIKVQDPRNTTSPAQKKAAPEGAARERGFDQITVSSFPAVRPRNPSHFRFCPRPTYCSKLPVRHCPRGRPPSPSHRERIEVSMLFLQ